MPGCVISENSKIEFALRAYSIVSTVYMQDIM